MGLILVLGGTRSGKSEHAERLARASGLPVRYVATATDDDHGMSERIARHAGRRPDEWETVVVEDRLSDPLIVDRSGRCVLVDGLGTWMAGVMWRAGAFDPGGPGTRAARTTIGVEIGALVDEAAQTTEPTIVVAEDAGHGMLPEDAASREWLDCLGDAIQSLSRAAERVVVVVAGRPLILPSEGIREPPETTLRDHGDTLLQDGLADHAVNVITGGPPAWLRRVLRDALDRDTAAYPCEDAATASLAALHGRAPQEIVPVNGATQALWLLPAALRPRLAACVHPGFTEAEAALRAHGVQVARVLRDPERDFALDPDAVPEEADLVVVGNPASPSGTLDPAAAVMALRRAGRVVVVDEAFMDLVPGEPSSLVRDRLDDVIVLRSVTKSLAIPGLRAGYAVATETLADRLRSVRPAWSCNALALAALAAIGGRPDALAEAAERAQAERSDLERRLAELEAVRVWPAAANYVLVRVADGPRTLARLREQGIAVRPAASFPGLGAGDLRITARDPKANARLAGALAQAVAA